MNAYDHYHCNATDDVESDNTIVGDRVLNHDILCFKFQAKIGRKQGGYVQNLTI